jgi:hypothetical protein
MAHQAVVAPPTRPTVLALVGAACLVVGPLAAVAFELITPVGVGSTIAQQVAQVAAHPGAMTASLACDGVALLLIPAVVLVAAVARPGAPRLAIAGGALAFAGYVCLTVVTVGDALLKAAATVADRSAAVAVVHAFWDTGLVSAMFVIYLAGHVAGMVLLAAALWRSRAVPRWAAVALGALVPLEVVEQAANSHAPGAIGYALVAVAFACCARVLIASSDDLVVRG